MFNVGQHTAVRNAFALAGHRGALRTRVVDSEDERIFVLDAADLANIYDEAALSQVVGQVLGRKVWVTESRSDSPTTPFG